ncbi:hypothetical protein TrVFT333_004438 [Trichoderma virens FT-333]|nr:hypothetical protein TrVFT333_004438 [Trichoderma virens FT-333]
MLLPSLLPVASLVSASLSNATDSSPKVFDWGSIVPSKQLEYHNCYDGFKCARLLVPLDWLNLEDERTVAIAIVKLPAAVPDDDPTFGGTVIFNPGGPGVSGVNTAVKGAARSVQQKLTDKPGIRYYEILSFDPRGVGNTAPASDCFRSDDFARNAWILEDRGKGSLTSGNTAISYGLGLMKFYSDRCKADEQLNKTLEYVGTPSVARDMVEIIDKIDELRKSEAGQRLGKRRSQKYRRLAESQGENAKDDEQVQGNSKKELHSMRGPEDKNNPVPRIQYLGFSYGTVLGNTFASMFPGRVGRMVLDGVVDAKDYYNRDGSTALKDTDKMFDEFWRGCFDASVTNCPFRLSYKTPKEAQQRFWEWITGRDGLNRYPVAVPSANGSLLVIRGSDVLVAAGDALQDPVKKFQPLALALYEGMINGNLTLMASLVDGTVAKVGDMSHPEPGEIIETLRSFLRNLPLCLLKLAVPLQMGVPQPLCDARPRSEPLYFARPAAPLLFLSNRLDPVTPLSSARAMAKGHPESGLLIQQSMGHTTWGGGPSRCTWEAVRNYFDDGRIQAKEFDCPADCDPWADDCDQTLAKRSNEGGQDWSVGMNMTAAI